MLVVDTGPLVAAAITRDRNHARCVQLLAETDGPLVVPALVVTEAAYLLGNRLGQRAELAFAAAIRAGEFEVEPVEPADWTRIVELVGRYDDLPLGIVDASVLACCERLGATTLGTLDRRHFSVVRPQHGDALTLLPE